MEVMKNLNIKSEPVSYEEDAFLKVKLQQSTKENCSFVRTKEAVSPEESSLVTVFSFEIKEETCDEVLKENENTVVKVKPDPSDDSTKDNIISKFSESDNETVDCSQHDVMSLKSEPKEEFQQINCQLEGLSDPNTCMKINVERHTRFQAM
ncbi:uncharacterized protein LOC143230854 isoform X2 [Tachypleus tridentatus]|uniref:uncharacterized protein LOC143230854 isoform X2 n=1 Tax=Tachypleus tridentatus TaxID=6853 RepID=UPI003FD696ED